MPKIWLFGDSFSSVDAKDYNARQWPLQLSSRLGYELLNYSFLRKFYNICRMKMYLDNS